MNYTNSYSEPQSIAKTDALWLIEYFQAENKAHPATQWILGLQTAQAWMHMLEMASIPDIELETLLRTVAEHKYAGSGWYDFALRVDRWIINQAIPIPLLFPRPFFDQ